jgi:hypothetical protein
METAAEAKAEAATETEAKAKAETEAKAKAEKTEVISKFSKSTPVDENPTILGYVLLLIMLLLATPIIIPLGILIMCIVIFTM